MHAQHEIRMMVDATPDEDKPTGAKTMTSLVALISKSVLGMVVLSLLTLAIATPTLAELGNTGKLIARGAGVAVSVRVACADDGEFGEGSVTLVQRVGNRITRGSDSSVSFECNRTPRTVRFLVEPEEVNGRTRAFVSGPAFARAFIFADGGEGNNGTLRDAEEIQLRR